MKSTRWREHYCLQSKSYLKRKKEREILKHGKPSGGKNN